MEICKWFNRGRLGQYNARFKGNIVANFDVVEQTRAVTFQTEGNWYNYISNGTGGGLNGNTFTIAAATNNIILQPGEYHVYMYHPTGVYLFNGNGNWTDAANWSYGRVPPIH